MNRQNAPPTPGPIRFDAPWISGAQLSLFGPDPQDWRDTPVIACEYPAPGIARCVISPVPPIDMVMCRNLRKARALKVRCAAVDDSGMHLIAPLIEFDGDFRHLLGELSSLMRRERDAGEPCSAAEIEISHAYSSSVFSPSADLLFDPAFWRIYLVGMNQPLTVVEQWARACALREQAPEDSSSAESQARLVDQLIVHLARLVDWLIGGLVPVLRAPVLSRRNLPYAIASNLHLRALSRGSPDALRYASQALLIEPIPLLRWIDSADSEVLSDTLLSGASLPKALIDLTGVSRPVIRHVNRYALNLPDVPVAAFRSMLHVLDEIDRDYWPYTAEQWGSTFEFLCSLQIPPDPVVPERSRLWLAAAAAGMRWDGPLRPGARGRSYEFWQGVFGFEVDMSALEVARVALDLYAELAPLSRGSNAYRLAASFWNSEMSVFFDDWLNTLPDLPAIRIGHHEFRCLPTLCETTNLGRLLRNCMESKYEALGYAVSGRVVFGVYDGQGSPRAMLAVQVAPGDDGEHLTLYQLHGYDNEPVETALEAAAIAFVRALSEEAESFQPFRKVGRALVSTGARFQAAR